MSTRPASDDVADRALEGERAGIVGDDAAHAGRNLFGAAGLEVECPVVRDVVGHQGQCISGSGTGRCAERKSKSQPSSACPMWAENIAP